ncbi:MAG: 1-(5-phosphoribosyl)-5-[(5-phosphoribosylamino)methylideneamino]imidazole-4-carboxamide isomerase [Actinomycetota bacterium]|nr:1-(5-phosphoribosyl)-5-[(5-phosphoribosylamino)methylideneamino]imidazole-4-carboxamide isomerase [Actinomycetota bacterium]
MIIYPAIDLKSGKCVRLCQGKMDEVTVYSDDPKEVAKRWQREGAEYIHVVDLDGAVTGAPKNLSLLGEIVMATKVPVQFGGGLRSLDVIDKVFEMGVSRAVVGTALIKDEAMLKGACSIYPGRIAVGLDVRFGYVAVSGWEEETKVLAVDLIGRLEELGVARIIYTDIMVDGTLKGPNLAAIESVAKSTNVPIIASGGVASLQDLADLAGLSPLGVEGAIVGKALYAGAFTLKEALEAVK